MTIQEIKIQFFQLLRDHPETEKKLYHCYCSEIESESHKVNPSQFLPYLVKQMQQWLTLDSTDDTRTVCYNFFSRIQLDVKNDSVFGEAPFCNWYKQALTFRLSFIRNRFSAKTIDHNQKGGSEKSSRDSSLKKYGTLQDRIGEESIDVLIPVANKDMVLMNHAVENLVRNSTTRIRNIFIVWQGPQSADDPITPEIPDEIKKRCNVVFVDEKCYPFSLSQVRNELEKLGSESAHGNWYFQQLLKLYAFRVLPDPLPRILIHDADVAFRRPTSFIDQSGRSILAYGYPFRWILKSGTFDSYGPIDQIQHSHIDHARRLVPNWELQNVFSGMQHHQLVDDNILESMLLLTEWKHGIPFWKAFIEQVDCQKWNGASEYVLYFHFATSHFPDQVKLRHVCGVDVIHDSERPFWNQCKDLLIDSQESISGCHGFTSLRERLETMDYIPSGLRKRLLAADELAFRLELRNGILDIGPVHQEATVRS